MLRSLIIIVMASFSFTAVMAQEENVEKVEKKAIKVKIAADEDGNMTVDTTIYLDEEFDGDWSKITDDEELLEKLKDIKVDLDIDGDNNVYLIKAPHNKKKGYFYSVDTDTDGEVKVDVIDIGEGEMEVIVESLSDDSTRTFTIKKEKCYKKGDKDVMVWISDDGEHKHGEKEYKVVVSESVDMDVEVEDGEKVITYKIKVDDAGDGEEKIMIWNSDESNEEMHDIMIEKLGDDDSKVIIIKADGDKDGHKVIKKEEIIIITEDDKDSDKKKKKKKKDK